MASRWRIRHKLLLGVGLVVAIMALLLCGTLYGLWSYYLTTNTIRAKLDELVAAEDFKAAVGELVTPEHMEKLTRDRLPGFIKKAHESLDVYAEQLEKTLLTGRDPTYGRLEKDMIDQLHKDLDTFQEAFLLHSPPAGVMPNGA